MKEKDLEHIYKFQHKKMKSNLLKYLKTLKEKVVT